MVKYYLNLSDKERLLFTISIAFMYTSKQSMKEVVAIGLGFDEPTPRERKDIIKALLSSVKHGWVGI